MPEQDTSKTETANTSDQNINDSTTQGPVQQSNGSGKALQATEGSAQKLPTGKTHHSRNRGRKHKVKRKIKPTSTALASAERAKNKTERKYIQRPYPQRTLADALRIPLAIKDKNNGNPLASEAVAEACGYTNIRSTSFVYLTYAARDYGLTTGIFSTEKIELHELGRKTVYAPNPEVERQSKIEAFFKVDIFKRVFDHYGGSKLPEDRYLSNTLENDFKLLPELHREFVDLFKANCKYLDITEGLRAGESATVKAKAQEATEHSDIRVVGQPKGKFDRTAFVIMPFRAPFRTSA
jgi:hypothetical protein